MTKRYSWCSISGGIAVMLKTFRCVRSMGGNGWAVSKIEGGVTNMAFLKRGNASIYYEEQGQGDPLIAVHGLILNTKYWSLTGIADTLAKSYRVISMEMRGHGRTVVDGKPYGFDVDTMGDDIIALADHLKLGRFHLLTHSTGGMASV